MRTHAPCRLVLLHGLASTPREFGLLIHPLRRLGVELIAPTVQGYSHELLSLSPARWQDWVARASDRVDAIAAESPEPFVLGGLCTGAMLAVAVAAHRRHPRLRGLALLSPLFAYDGWSLPWWYRLRHLAYLLGLERRFSMRERPPYGLKNERLREWIRKQMRSEQATVVGPAQVSLQIVRESERISRHARECLAHLGLPILALHAVEDEICDVRSAQSALTLVAPHRLRMELLHDSYHMITADNDRERVAQTIADFLCNDLGLAQPAPGQFGEALTESGDRLVAS